MRTHLMMKLGLLAVAGSALLVAPDALADDTSLLSTRDLGQPSLRLEPGIAIPLTSPQTDHFGPGGYVAVKPTVGVLPWLDANLTLAGMALSPKDNGASVGALLGVGPGLRAKRPHDASNTGTGLTAVSPWIDTDALFARTGGLDRAELSIGAGASVPTDSTRSFWVGPFVRYMDVVDSLSDAPNTDHSDAHVLILGLSFEVSPPAKKAAPAAPPPPVPAQAPKVQAPPPPAPLAPVESTTEAIRMKIVVQFPFDSAVPLPESADALKQAASTILDKNASLTSQTIEIDGHASSEGRVKHNDKLSTQRAQAVADYLVKAGLPKDKLVVKGFGSRVPVADNSTEAGRILNRRVEFQADVTITKAGGSK